MVKRYAMPSIPERHSGLNQAMNASLIKIADLSVSFGRGGNETLAVNQVSFDIGRGET